MYTRLRISFFDPSPKPLTIPETLLSFPLIVIAPANAVMSHLPPSPPSEPSPPPLEAEHVPLDSSIRTCPIHALLPDIRVPSDPLPPCRYHPVTCAPLDVVKIRSELQQLRKEYPTPTAILKAQDEAAKQVKQRMKAAAEKSDYIQKIMKTKTDERDMERRVFSKIKKGEGAKGLPYT